MGHVQRTGLRAHPRPARPRHGPGARLGHHDARRVTEAPGVGTLQSMRAIGVCASGFLALAGGCSSYSAPGLRVTAVTVKDRTPTGTVLDFAIEASNRNEVELPLREVRYSVS